MQIPENLLYTENHEWVLVEGDTATVGITDYAQGELGDIVFVEFPAVGDAVSQGTTCTTLEAVKTVADVYAPVSGEVVEINADLESDPQLINQDVYGSGWILKIKMSDASEKDSLLTPDKYESLLA